MKSLRMIKAIAPAIFSVAALFANPAEAQDGPSLTKVCKPAQKTSLTSGTFSAQCEITVMPGAQPVSGNYLFIEEVLSAPDGSPAANAIQVLSAPGWNCLPAQPPYAAQHVPTCGIDEVEIPASGAVIRVEMVLPGKPGVQTWENCAQLGQIAFEAGAHSTWYDLHAAYGSDDIAPFKEPLSEACDVVQVQMVDDPVAPRQCTPFEPKVSCEKETGRWSVSLQNALSGQFDPTRVNVTSLSPGVTLQSSPGDPLNFSVSGANPGDVIRVSTDAVQDGAGDGEALDLCCMGEVQIEIPQGETCEAPPPEHVLQVHKTCEMGDSFNGYTTECEISVHYEGPPPTPQNPIVVDDLMQSTPWTYAGLTNWTAGHGGSSSVGWNCTPAPHSGPTPVSCSIDASRVSGSQNWASWDSKFTLAYTTPETFRNCAEASATGAGTDESCYSNGKTELEIVKQMVDGQDGICRPGLPCQFSYTVTNTGGDDYQGPITLVDTPTVNGTAPGGSILSITPALCADAADLTSGAGCTGTAIVPAGGSMTYVVDYLAPLDLVPGAVPHQGKNCVALSHQNSDPSIEPSEEAGTLSCTEFEVGDPALTLTKIKEGTCAPDTDCTFQIQLTTQNTPYQGRIALFEQMTGSASTGTISNITGSPNAVPASCLPPINPSACVMDLSLPANATQTYTITARHSAAGEGDYHLTNCATAAVVPANTPLGGFDINDPVSIPPMLSTLNTNDVYFGKSCVDLDKESDDLPPELDVAKTCSATLVGSDMAVECTVTVTGQNLAPGQTITLEDHLNVPFAHSWMVGTQGGFMVENSPWDCQDTIQPSPGILPAGECTLPTDDLIAAGGSMTLYFAPVLTGDHGGDANDLENCVTASTAQVSTNQTCVPIQVSSPTPPPGDADIIVLKRFEEHECSVGGACDFTLSIVNNSTTNSYSGPVGIRDQDTPGGLQIIGMVPPVCTPAPTVTPFDCVANVNLAPQQRLDITVNAFMPLGGIDVGSSETIENCAKGGAVATGVIGDWPADLFQDQAGVCVQTTMCGFACHMSEDAAQQLSVNKVLLNEAECLPGGVCTYRIEVQNTGLNSVSSPITLAENLPAGGVISALRSLPWSCGPGAGGTTECAHPPMTLAAGQSTSFEIDVAIPAGYAGDEIGNCVSFAVDKGPAIDPAMMRAAPALTLLSRPGGATEGDLVSYLRLRGLSVTAAEAKAAKLAPKQAAETVRSTGAAQRGSNQQSCVVKDLSPPQTSLELGVEKTCSRQQGMGVYDPVICNIIVTPVDGMTGTVTVTDMWQNTGGQSPNVVQLLSTDGWPCNAAPFDANNPAQCSQDAASFAATQQPAGFQVSAMVPRGMFGTPGFANCATVLVDGVPAGETCHTFTPEVEAKVGRSVPSIDVEKTCQTLTDPAPHQMDCTINITGSDLPLGETILISDELHQFTNMAPDPASFSNLQFTTPVGFNCLPSSNGAFCSGSSDALAALGGTATLSISGLANSPGGEDDYRNCVAAGIPGINDQDCVQFVDGNPIDPDEFFPDATVAKTCQITRVSDGVLPHEVTCDLTVTATRPFTGVLEVHDSLTNATMKSSRIKSVSMASATQCLWPPYTDNADVDCEVEGANFPASLTDTMTVVMEFEPGVDDGPGNYWQNCAHGPLLNQSCANITLPVVTPVPPVGPIYSVSKSCTPPVASYFAATDGWRSTCTLTLNITGQGNGMFDLRDSFAPRPPAAGIITDIRPSAGCTSGPVGSAGTSEVECWVDTAQLPPNATHQVEVDVFLTDPNGTGGMSAENCVFTQIDGVDKHCVSIDVPAVAAPELSVAKSCGTATLHPSGQHPYSCNVTLTWANMPANRIIRLVDFPMYGADHGQGAFGFDTSGTPLVNCVTSTASQSSLPWPSQMCQVNTTALGAASGTRTFLMNGTLNDQTSSVQPPEPRNCVVAQLMDPANSAIATQTPMACSEIPISTAVVTDGGFVGLTKACERQQGFGAADLVQCKITATPLEGVKRAGRLTVTDAWLKGNNASETSGVVQITASEGWVCNTAPYGPGNPAACSIEAERFAEMGKTAEMTLLAQVPRTDLNTPGFRNCVTPDVEGVQAGDPACHIFTPEEDEGGPVGTGDGPVLEVEKALSQACDVNKGAQKYTCEFEVAVVNTGSAPYTGPLVLNDTFGSPSPRNVDTKAAEGFECLRSDGKALSCLSGDANIAPGDKAVFNMTLTLPGLRKGGQFENCASVGVGDSKFHRAMVIQSVMQKLGIDGGPVDGAPGRKTRAGVRELQERLGLEPTGEIDEALFAAVGVPAADADAKACATAPLPPMPVVCEPGQKLNSNGVCFWPRVECKKGEKRNAAGKCYKPDDKPRSCKKGQKRNSKGVCYWPKCKSGFKRNSKGVCVKVRGPRCDARTTVQRNGECVCRYKGMRKLSATRCGCRSGLPPVRGAGCVKIKIERGRGEPGVEGSGSTCVTIAGVRVCR